MTDEPDRVREHEARHPAMTVDRDPIGAASLARHWALLLEATSAPWAHRTDRAQTKAEADDGTQA